jgi:hypothetical protein
MTMDRVEVKPAPTGGLSTHLFKRLRWTEGAIGTMPAWRPNTTE